MYQIIPRLQKVLQVEIFHRVPLPNEIGKTTRRKIRTKVISAVISSLQGRSVLDFAGLRELFEKFYDPYYTSFLNNVVDFVSNDIRHNVLNGMLLFIDEPHPVTRRSDPSFVGAKNDFHRWIPVHYNILQRFEAHPLTRQPLHPRHPVLLAPFTVLPAFDFTPKNIIINTDMALYDLWMLANWEGVQRPANIDAFKANSDFWWRHTFKSEKVETTLNGQRRFRMAVYTDGTSYKMSVAKRVSVLGTEEHGEAEDEDDCGDEVADDLVGDAGESTDDEVDIAVSKTKVKRKRKATSDVNGNPQKKRRRTTANSGPADDAPPPGFDRFFQPVDIPAGTTVWGIDPNRRDPFYAVNNVGKKYSVTSRHYYKLCGFTDARRKRERWLRGAPTVSQAMDVLSRETYKTSSLVTFDSYWSVLLPNLTLILDHYFRPRHRRSNFNSYIRKEKAWHTILKPFKDCVVGLGAGLFAHNSRGNRTGPVKQLRKQLKRRVSLLRLIGEYNTSKVCHLCEGFFGGRQRWWALRICRDVCGGRVMNRDYNAAMNILAIFLFMNIHGGQRPEPFFHKWDTLPPQLGVH
jgi:hypothetical protein